MSGSFDSQGRLDISDGRLILCVGKKKSGKSVMGKLLFASYPGDRIVIDVAKDDGPIGGPIIDLQGTVDTLPEVWPEHRREDDQPMTLRYAPDGGSPTFLEDVDAVLGLAIAQGDRQRDAGKLGCCVLIHEIGVVAKVHQTQPNMRRILMHNRHNAVTAIMCGPRPMNIDTLVLAQADVVYAFELPNIADRKRLADTIGEDSDVMNQAFKALGPHEYLRFDANEDKPQDGDEDQRLLHFERLPDDIVAAVAKAR